MRTSIVVCLLLIPFPCAGDEPAKNENATKDRPKIRLFAAEKTAAKGLLVEIVKPVKRLADGRVAFSYDITNLLDEEVFVELRDNEDVVYEYRDDGGGLELGGTGRISFPDNVYPLKRLHASIYRSEQRITCGCATMRVRAIADLPKETDKTGKANVQIVVTGFFRATGSPFYESIDMPLPFPNE